MDELTVGWIVTQGLWGVAALAACWFLRIHHPGRVVGPRRLSPSEPTRSVALLFLVVLAGWILPQLGYALILGQEPDGGGAQASFTAHQLIVLGLLGYLGAGTGLFFGNTLRRRPLGEFGLRVSQLPRGLRDGVIGAAIAIPLVFWSGVATELVYRQIGYEHPMEHEMLRMLSDAPPLTMGLILLMAVLLAPLAEEVIFRGLLQTLAVRVLERLGAGSTLLPREEAPVPPARRRPGTVWAGIIFCSIAFALVHEPWSIPPIFVLSLCLGYVYERTGNLWSAIVLHLLFNGASTVQFLLVR